MESMRNSRKALLSTLVPALAATLAGLLALSGCSGSAGSTESSTPAAIKGSVVTTGPSSQEMQITVPDAVTNQWNALGSGNGVQWISSPNTTDAAESDVTLGSSDADQAFTQKINATQGAGTQRSLLTALSQVSAPASTPVWVFSPLLDTVAPLDFGNLAFDETPASVVKKVQAAGKLPTTLKGRAVSVVVTPTAGEQQAPGTLQTGYIRAVWEGLFTAAGAKSVTFYVGTGTQPGQGTGPVVKIPSTADIKGVKNGNQVVCTLPTPALFAPDTDTFTDKAAVLAALKKCVAQATNATRITVEGHTAGDPSASNAFAKALSTQRATAVAAALKELGVKPQMIQSVVGYGSTKPLVQPGTDPANRAVVVRFTVPK